MRLSIRNHDRDAAGLEYVYPVLSRRARGVSIGINLNPNKACNWRCIYCQVPGLVRGSGPEIDLERLERELHDFLAGVVHGNWMEEHVPEGSRRLADVAFSGDGEPTTSKQFAASVETLGRVLASFGLVGELESVLITNGSLVHRPEVLRGLEALRAIGGSVWFKLDGGTPAARERMNDVKLTDERLEENLALCARACPTRIQTIVLAQDGRAPSAQEQDAYLRTLERALAAGVPLVDVLLYGLERESHQPEAPRLSKLPVEWLESFAARIRELGLGVSVHP
jgi:wyosine [tRNA(Phe)-imidazoG37] synthetase (radical SAM superfamily)